MPQGKKTTLFKKVTHLRITATIYIDRDSGKFWGEIAGQRIENELAAETERLIKEAIEHSMTTTWQPVVVLTVSDYGDHSHVNCGAFAVSYDRKYIGDVPELGWADTQWHAKDDSQRVAWATKLPWIIRDHGEFMPPCRRYWGGSKTVTYYLPYSDALWAACEALVNGIRGLDTTIRESFDKGGVDLLETIMPLLTFMPVE